MTGFEPWISGVGINRFTNCATTKAQPTAVLLLFQTDIFSMYGGSMLHIAYKSLGTCLLN